MPFDPKNPNLALWLREMPTDPKLTIGGANRDVVKPFKKGGGFSGSAINATYTVMRLTQAFGPVGIGWGYDVQDVRDVWPPGKETGLNFVLIRFWYQHDGKRGEFSQVGGTEYTGRGDDEVVKKSLTDAITKAASHIGFASDIHLGLWDDNKYVEDRAAESASAQEALTQAAATVTSAEAMKEVDALKAGFAAVQTKEDWTELRAEGLKLLPRLKSLGFEDLAAELTDAVRASMARLGIEAPKRAA